MDYVKWRDEDKHNHHVEGSSTSYNNTFLIPTQVSNSTKCEKKERSQKQTNLNFYRLNVHNAHLNKMWKKKLSKSEKGLLVRFKA
jgi:hypothetical protein